MLSLSAKTGLSIKQYEYEEQRRSQEDSASYWVVAPGDVVLNPMWIFKGAVAASRLNYVGIVSPAYVVFRPDRHHDPRFIAYQLMSAPMTQWYRAEARGETTYDRAVKWDALRGLPLLAPSLTRQRAIADFLDRECAALEALSASLNDAGERLDELRKVAVDRCVANAPQSRLGWVGEVRSGLTLNGQASDDQGIPYLRVANVQADHVDLSDVKRIRVAPDQAARHALRPGDLLMTEGGDIDKLGRGPVWRGELDPCLHQNHVFAVRLNPARVLPEFAAAATRSSAIREYFESTASRITNIASTNATKVRAMPLPMPSLDEQRRRLSILREEEERLDAATAALLTAADRLAEYREAVITEAVTGQIDVPQTPDLGVGKRLHTAVDPVQIGP